jgi:hypothetical protein
MKTYFTIVKKNLGIFPLICVVFFQPLLKALWGCENLSCDLVSSIPWKTTFVSLYKIKIFIQFFSTTHI